MISVHYCIIVLQVIKMFERLVKRGNMYNLLLDTFIVVVNYKSFSKAAKKLKISTTAVVKQMNSLEELLGLSLFERSPRGIKVTAVGEYIYSEAKNMIIYSEKVLQEAKLKRENDNDIIRIGTSLISPESEVIRYLPELKKYYKECSLDLIYYENKPDIAMNILKNLGDKIDVVCTIYDEDLTTQRGCNHFQITELLLICLVSTNNKLYEKESINIEDLYGEYIYLITRGWSTAMDNLRDYIEKNHPQINIIDFSFVSMDIFNKCENNGYILIFPDVPYIIHPFLKKLNVDWEYKMPYGIIYSQNPSEKVKKFINAFQLTLS